MTRSEPTRSTIRWIPAALVMIVIGAAGVALEALPTSSSSASPAPVLRGEHRAPRREPRRPLGEADGALPDGTTVFEGEIPGVAKLDQDLLDALRRAANDSGLELVVDSGWRSPAYQQHLLDEAVAEHGSAEEAARWVATPQTSAHVSGDAADIGPPEAAAWLSAHGAAYGLCQTYANEPWHYELRPGGCPPMYADPTQDPRM